MITSISKIKDFGLFRNYTPTPDLKPFKRINIFYGWNGSGKSTISRLFRCFEMKKIHEDYPNAGYELIDDVEVTYNETFLIEPPKLKVFNTDFIAGNINLSNSKTEPIVYISEEKISEKKKLDELREEREKNLHDQKLKKTERNNVNKTIEVFHKTSGKVIKDFLLGTIHADVTYNKATSEKIWGNIKKTGTSLNEFIKSDDILSQQRDFVLVNAKREPITFNLNFIDIDLFKNIQLKVSDLAFKNIVNKSISRLKKDSALNSWVFSGLGLHKSLSSLKCEFCGQSLPEDRLALLEGHFNEEYSNLLNELKGLRENLSNLLLPEIPDFKLRLFEFLKPNFDLHYKAITSYQNEINNYIRSWIQLVDAKTNNPFINEGTINSDNSFLYNYNSSAEALNSLITSHNKHVDDYNLLSEQSRIVIENHFVAQKAFSEDFRKIEGNLLTIENDITKLDDALVILEEKINSAETSLKTDIIAINQINQNLSHFIGNKDIKLVRYEGGGYELQRDGLAAKNISEGEKTAIALVYFVAKLNEKGDKIEDTIVMIDDPISSFDCNHLFHANYFLKIECKKAKQIFILTHNFHFFTLLKDWATTNDEIEFYLIKSKLVDKVRHGFIENCNNIIKYFSSEYHFLFKEVYDFVQSPDKEYIEIHVISNICRQLLESFLTFKFGRKRLDKCFDEIKDFKDVDKVQKFVNYYSHRANYGASIEGFSDNLVSEVDSIVPLVFSLIEHVDKTHFDSMVARINNT